MAETLVTERHQPDRSTGPIPGLDLGRLERLTRAVAAIRGGKPLAHGGGLHHPRAVADGLEFQEHRPLLPGDDPRRVDWRASARSRHPLVRRYRDERAGEWVICLDRSASMALVPDLWPRALQLAAGLAYLIMHFEHRVGLALFSARLDHLVQPGRGQHAFLALVRALGQAQPEGAGGASEPERCRPLLDPGRRAILISDYLRPDGMIPALNQLSATSGGVEVLHLAPAPPTLPLGEQVIADVEDGGRRPLIVTVESRAAALARWQALNRDLERHCRARHIPYTRWNLGTGLVGNRANGANGTAEGWERTLLRHLTGRAEALD
ncbi:hypothetical protein THSYN_14945 [Candidatus Thiodictyon syntrophicum]|uniref:DUF58 domain-containing protein n=1 Tax=Candidatus Thiodictyon syntrophicum TaxID=1166950 RepID=A0A2K8U939_9GAMM|nr:hypothetical protein THSYN_14945 [Candidatus Thiodictyon syntrophicum]